MHPLKVLSALLGFSALGATVPAGISLDIRDEGKKDCGVVTVYVTAPESIGESYSMTFTRTSYDTAFITKTVGKSTAMDVVEITLSPSVSPSEKFSVIITDSAALSISSEIPSSVEETTTLRATLTRTQTRTLFETTTLVNGDVEVNPVTVVEESVIEVTSVPRATTRFSAWTRWHTTTIRTTTTLPGGNVVVSSYTATNEAPVTFSIGKGLHNGPATMATMANVVTPSQEPKEDFDPNAEIVVVEITRVVQPLSTVPAPAETTSTESSVTYSQLVGTPHAPFPIFTAVPIKAIVNDNDLDRDEKTTTLSTSTSVTISITTIYTESGDAIATSSTSGDGSSQTLMPSSNSSIPTHKYSGVPTGWNHTYSTMTKVYVSVPGYGYEHLSHDYSASGSGFTAPVSLGETSVQTGSLIFPTDGPASLRSSVIQSDASADPGLSSLPPVEFNVVSPIHTTAAQATYGYEYGNANPYISVDKEEYATNTGYWKVYTTSHLVSVTDSDGLPATAGYWKFYTSSVLVSVSGTNAAGAPSAEIKTSHSALFSHVVSDLPVDKPSYVMPSYGAGLPSLSASSSGASNATKTTASRDGDSSTRSTISVKPTSLESPSFQIPTSVETGLPPLASISSVLTAELPASIISLWSSLEAAESFTTSVPVISAPPPGLTAPSSAIPTSIDLGGLPPLESFTPVFTEELPASTISLWSSIQNDQTSSRSQVTAPTASLVAPSFSAPPPPTLISTPTDDVATVASSSSSSASATATSCGEQGAFSLNFDDIPPLVGDVDQPLPISSPYKHFYFSEGFAVGPPPRIPFVPESAPLILQFQTQSDVNVTRNDNFPLPGEYGATGEIANGPNLRFGCYSFNAVAASVGCDSLGPPCQWQFTGVTCDPVTGDCNEPYTQFATTPGCPAGENCVLTDFVFLDNFTNIQGLRVNVTVEGVPKIWWMDDLQLKWSDDSCDAGICRASHR